ncbi:MAG: polysaccharide deacetylase family protein [Bacteroidetes bacterium]|nr:polysaccharide deacetylase family protein [Bacteroidota bacterium]
MYLVKTPWWLRNIYPGLVWRMPEAAGAEGPGVAGGKTMYLTFDDGPHPEATPFVLEQLRKYNARATFFCIGKNVKEQPEIYRQILMEGHRVGNHTQNHLNGWKTEDKKYLENIELAAQLIDSNLFRPPYGRIGAFQAKLLRDANYKIIMWEVLSGDFDRGINATKCARNVIKHAQPGSIVVFHDSEKAFDRLKGALPEVLEHFSGKGYRFDVIK